MRRMGSMNRTVKPPMPYEFIPERVLMEAILEQAASDLSIATTDVVEEVVAWFEDRPYFIDEERIDWLYTYSAICEELGVDKSYILQKLKKKYASRWNLKGPRMVPGRTLHSFVSIEHCHKCRQSQLKAVAA
jgi:hypothetical protein